MQNAKTNKNTIYFEFFFLNASNRFKTNLSVLYIQVEAEEEEEEEK